MPGIAASGSLSQLHAERDPNETVVHRRIDVVEDDGCQSEQAGHDEEWRRALQDAGRPIVPVTGSPFNLTTTTCAETAGAQCILAPNPAYLSAEALKLAVQILDGKPPAEKRILLRNAFLTTDPAPSKLFPDAVMNKIEIGKNAYPDMPPGLFLPVSPDWLEITPKEASGT